MLVQHLSEGDGWTKRVRVGLCESLTAEGLVGIVDVLGRVGVDSLGRVANEEVEEEGF